MTHEEMENFWKDPENWKRHVYYCQADARVIVPRRFKWMGWTVNFARPSAIPVLLLVVAILTVPLLFEDDKRAGAGIEVATEIASMVILCLVCAHFSSRTK